MIVRKIKKEKNKKKLFVFEYIIFEPIKVHTRECSLLLGGGLLGTLSGGLLGSSLLGDLLGGLLGSLGGGFL